MPVSMESSRPIMAPSNRASLRYSTYSMAAPSVAMSVQTTDSQHAEIREIATGLDRMENKALSSQRVTLSEEKYEKMSNQDAVMRPRRKTTSAVEKSYNEKAAQ
ncbi:hypothetical protein GGI42DRAFT_53439 [Trichoderma sp. SZMC 28013]